MGNSASSLPYSVGKQIAFVNHGWALHDGNRKSDGAIVSVFLAKKPALQKTPVNPRQPNLTQYAAAQHHFVNCKKLRHPHILSVLATLDTDNPNDTAPTGLGSAPPTTAPTATTGDFIIVTEPCTTLDVWLQSRPPLEEIAWGLECIIRGLHFLHASANLCHGNLSPESFYVTPSGDVKIWNFSLLSSFAAGNNNSQCVPRHFVDWEGLITPQPYRAPERVEGRWDAIAAAGVHVLDSFGLSLLIAHLFGGIVPNPLLKAVQRLQTPNLKMRPRLQPLLKCPLFDTPYQKLQLQFEEFAVQSVDDKILIWQNLTPNIQAEVVPKKLAVYKLLPLMKAEIETICLNEGLRAQEVYRREVLAILNPLFYIAENFIDAATVGEQLGKVSGILFKVNDRAIRGTLLQKAPFMAGSFDRNTLNEAVFEPMCSGFSDSSAALRELTLKATAALVPHLTHPNLEKLSRYLVRLQSDPESSIRTNTVIFFSKLAPYLTESTRQKMLLPAFVRAMKDPFTPCRLAALKSTLKAKEFFDPMGIASRVMPAITPQLLDPSAEVRREAFTAVDDLLFVLRQESERLNSLPEPSLVNPSPSSVPQTNNAAQARPVTATAPPVKPVAEVVPKSSFSLGGISSWMTNKATPAAAAAQPPVVPAPSAPPNYSAQSGLSVQPPRQFTPSVAPNSMNLNGSEDWNEEADDGWDDDDLDVSGGGLKVGGTPTRTAASGSKPFPAAVPVTASTASGSLFDPAASEDDFFGSFDAKPAKPVTIRAAGVGKLVVPVKKAGAKLAVTKPAIKKLSGNDSTSEGWDDF